MKTLVITEIGSAWRFGEDHLQNAYRAIYLAKDCGADIVKFQWVSDPRAMEKRRNVPEGSYDILAWPKLWISMLHEKCESVGIEFLCTVFLPLDVATMNPYVKRWKVASLESGDGKLCSAMLKTGKPIITSYGCTADVGVRWANEQCESLHCTAAYPASLESLNLLAIGKNEYDGYSDHSCHILTGAIAVACGAKIVEVHFKLPGTPSDNPDYGHSLWPEQLDAYIKNIRMAELMIGNVDKKIQPCEQWALKHKVKT
jgi:sialic acid synthase SpsE